MAAKQPVLFATLIRGRIHGYRDTRPNAKEKVIHFERGVPKEVDEELASILEKIEDQVQNADPEAVDEDGRREMVSKPVFRITEGEAETDEPPVRATRPRTGADKPVVSTRQPAAPSGGLRTRAAARPIPR